MAIRVAVTGRTATPPLFDTLVALGRERTLERLDRAVAALRGRECAPMTHDDVQLWLDRYVAAWSSYDPAAIGDLFSRGRRVPLPAVGRPGRRPRRHRRRLAGEQGRARDVVGALRRRGRSTASRASAIGESRYTNPDGSFRTLYYNNCLLRFDGHGRCVEFVEYFMELPERLRAGR